MSWLNRFRSPHGSVDSVDEQSLVLRGSQLIHWEVDGDQLILDLWGGQGSWMGFRDGQLTATGEVTQPPAFTIRAHLGHILDLGLLSQLDRLATTSELLTVRIDSAGAGLLENPVSMELSDGVESLRVNALA